MLGSSSRFPGQEAAPLSVTMEVEEDIEQEIESFVRFKRRREYEKAEEIFKEMLSAHLSLFPVIAEYADLLLVQEKYRILSEFLDIQIQYMEPVLEEEEVELLQIMRSLVHIHTCGSLRPALIQADRTWTFLYQRSVKLTVGALPSDVEIHVFEIYIRIMVFAAMNSNWVRMNDMKCPWASEEDSDNYGFVQWYSILCCNGHTWSASQVLILLLQALPLFGEQDVAVLFGKHCFGEIPNKQALCKMSELNQLIACSVSFSRAQVLLDLSLRIRKFDPDEDWWTVIYQAAIYRVAAYYHHAANFLPTIMRRYELNANVQKSQFELVQESLINDRHLTTFPDLGYDDYMIALDQHDPRCLIISFFNYLLRVHRRANGGLKDPRAVFNLQLHDQVNMIGFIQTFELSLTLTRNCLTATIFGGYQRAQYQTASLSQAPDSLSPMLNIPFVERLDFGMNDPEIRSLVDSLSLTFRNNIPSIISKMSPVLEFRQSQELSHTCGETSESFDIPAYLWALHNMPESSKEAIMVPPGWSENPWFSESYVEMIRKFLPQAVSKSQVKRLADWILGAWGTKVGAEKYTDKTQETETRQDSLGSNSTPTEIFLDPDTQTAKETESKHGGILGKRPIRPSQEPQEGTTAGLQFPVPSPPTEENTVKDEQKQAATKPSPTEDESSTSYAKICKNLRAELMRCLERPEDYEHRFIIRGAAQKVLQGKKMIRLFESLHLPEIGFRFSKGDLEKYLAKSLNEKHLQDFLAILIFSMYDIEAVQKFAIKVLATESWPAERCSLPTSQAILRELFDGQIASYPFLANQAMFCPTVITKGSTILVPSFENQRLPYLLEEPLGARCPGSVFKVKIARGHLYDPVTESANQDPVEVARKDYIRSDSVMYRELPEYPDILEAILTLGNKCETIIESFGALGIGSSTYSRFMPLAICDLGQYMRYNHLRGPATRARRLEFFENIHGLANGLRFLHSGLKTKGLDGLVCYDCDLEPESVLLFRESTSQRLTWKLSDFKTSRVKYRRRGEESDRVIDLKKHFSRPRESTTARSPTSTATKRRGKGTCLAPESIATPPIMSPRSDVWSLGCVISIVFTYLEEGASGVRKYAESRAANKKASGSDRFFIGGRGKVRPSRASPVIEEWHSRLITSAMHRSRCEGKAVESTLRFLESAVFQEETKRCDAYSMEQKVVEIWKAYEEEVEITEERQTSLERFLQGPLIRRIIPRRKGQEGQHDED
ncbi:hypothetical protein PMG11_09811 [Penicillium brasilianum]|uniref:Protein kinase domain-containing protein n=1 Tax=Penicillium brasilianum TaxID=104259 RepID=A0A0F7TX59_PENBI|nr:hypothetical protein PMG11_09811 [Penicillium brasilianum]